MRLIRPAILCLAVVFVFPSFLHADLDNLKIVLLISARDTITVTRAIREISAIPDIGKQCRLKFFTAREIRGNRVQADDVNNADVIMADFMKSEIDQFLSDTLTSDSVDIYSLRCGYLAGELKKRGMAPDLRAEAYYNPVTVDNSKNMILMVLSQQGVTCTFDPPLVLPASGIFHPHADRLFSSFDDYLQWYRENNKLHRDANWIGVHTFRSSAANESGKLEAHIIAAVEKKGYNVLPVFGKPPYHQSLEKYFLAEDGSSRVQAICGFSFRFLRGFPEKTRHILHRINAPVFMPLEAHGITIRQWEASHTGISPLRTAWQVCIPEQNGAIEPTLVGGKTMVRLKGMTDVLYDRQPLPGQIDYLVRRIEGWFNLRDKPNPEKRIALLYWNHPPGKQNIGGSYMNCFRSIAAIVNAMKQDGYRIDSENLNEESIRQRILHSGRNVGAWAPGELDRLVAGGGVVKIPVSRYRQWFAELPEGFRREVTRQWGEPEDSDIMVKDGNFIIPQVDLGHLVVMPQPSRGFGEDPDKLYHDPKIYPHHQYIAFYLWLKKSFKADAVISLGKHGTHEWLPGKQIGLSTACPPDVLIQDIPNIYPYIVDNIGEGIQAKRRGRGVIIDHMIPPLKKGGLYMAYRELTAVIDAYHTARQTDDALAGEKLKRIADLIRELALDKELALDVLDDAAVETVEHYILELQETLIPYGHHTFGVSPGGQALDDLTAAICEASPETALQAIKASIKACGEREIDALLRALKGGYVAAGEGNDPVRNPDAVPTGKNFYGFNIDKVPSREAWALGKKLSDGMVESYREKHGTWPDKLGIILWSTELQRNEGASIAAVFHLLGISPVWDKKDQVVDIEPIPGVLLKRPRIDVLVQSSGLFRDSYAKVIQLIDRAVRMAGAQKDVENFIEINSRKIEQALLQNGYATKEAAELSRARVFAPMPGAYSHALQELIPNSGVWEDESEISDVFIHHYSFAYGDRIWGKSLKSAYKANLQEVKVTMHTRSSNLYGLLDNDDMFAFLGGLSMAVKSQTGDYPETWVANMQDAKGVTLEDLPKAIGKALRSRYLNPEWIKGMKREGYSGAKAMDEFVEYLWGFQVTSPYAVNGSQWKEIHDVYIEDKYGRDLKAFFDKYNPWARQSIAARMLETDRKGYWKAPEEIKKNLARTFALNVIEKGVACCEHTCNNPMFQEYVTNLISLAGLLTPMQLDAFKAALAKAAGQPLDELKKEYRKVRKNLENTTKEIRKQEKIQAKAPGDSIEGLEIVEENNEKTQITTSGSAWQVMVMVGVLLALLTAGWKRMDL